ncbi:MAG: leucine-rich repeat domain-containing protein [Crocinitomicaceae bacterium]|nr:leucine-rich repeat domain-containing protein [Crocinitomicaceae bacterium]
MEMDSGYFFQPFYRLCGFYSSGSALKSSRNGKLDLSKSGLTEIPDYVFKLTELRCTNLHDNKITKFLDGIGNLVNLEKLIVSRNDLTYISPEIGKTDQS